MKSVSTTLFSTTVGMAPLLGLLAMGSAQADEEGAGVSVLGYIRKVPPESPQARAARCGKVARRRKAKPLMVHRGASKLAPENTLEAYAAAMDHGADGVEIDIRRSKDGVLYLFHDGTLDRMTNGAGKVSRLTYYELLKLGLKRIYGTATRQTRTPTLAAFLVLARQRAMLIHLDVKEAGLQDEIEKMLNAADVWDHIVEVNAGNAEKLRHHSKVKLLRYKGWFPEGGAKPDLDAINALLVRPGEMIFCRDPRVPARFLGRRAREAVPLPDGIRAEWTPAGIATTQPATAPRRPPMRDSRAARPMPAPPKTVTSALADARPS